MRLGLIRVHYGIQSMNAQLNPRKEREREIDKEGEKKQIQAEMVRGARPINASASINI